MRKLILIYIFSLSSCSLLGLQTSEDLVQEDIPEQTEVEQINYEETEERRAPIKVKIVKSYLDEKDRLNVKVLLESETQISPEQVQLTLQGLKEGDVVEQQVLRLSELTPFEMLRRDQSLAVLLQLPSSDFSEYQVRLSWGEDATRATRAKLASKPEEAKAKEETKEEVVKEEGEVTALSIKSKLFSEPTECPEAPCDLMYKIVSKLKNKADHPIANIKLALGIFWQANRTKVGLPADFSAKRKNEKLVDLKSFVLAPGKSKKLKIAVDRPVPISDKGKFLPHLRILSAEEVR